MSVVLESMKDDVFTITLNRPDKKNAMDYDLLAGLYEAMKNAAGQKAPFVVIRGSGALFARGATSWPFGMRKMPRRSSTRKRGS